MRKMDNKSLTFIIYIRRKKIEEQECIKIFIKIITCNTDSVLL